MTENPISRKITKYISDLRIFLCENANDLGSTPTFDPVENQESIITEQKGILSSAPVYEQPCDSSLLESYQPTVERYIRTLIASSITS